MRILAPDILEEARLLSPILSGAAVLIGLLLWSLGGRTHRFWLAMLVTLTAGLMGLTEGKQFGMQPLAAGLLLAISAGVLALSLVRILLFAAGGLATLALLHNIAPAWEESIAVFLVGGLIGVLLYRFWITTFSALIGAVLMTYGALALFDRLHMVNSVELAGKNGPLWNWAFASLAVTGVLVQFLLERRRQRKARTAEAPPEAAPEAVAVAAPLPPAPAPAEKPTRSVLRMWSDKLLHRRAG